LKSIGRDGMPRQWHVEASSRNAAQETWTATVMRMYRTGRALAGKVAVVRKGATMRITIPESGVVVELSREGKTFAVVKKGGREWRFAAADDIK
jgi:hypothetical protein